jgi:predicted transcriptional regulator
MKQRKIDDTQLLEMLKEGKLQKDIAEHFGVSPAAVCKRLKRLLPQPVEVL